MANAGLIVAIAMLAGGWLLEIASAKNFEKWLTRKGVKYQKGNGMFRRFRNAFLYQKECKSRDESGWWGLAYVGGVAISFGGIVLLLYLKGTNRI
jgi:hypothetical protein